MSRLANGDCCRRRLRSMSLVTFDVAPQFGECADPVGQSPAKTSSGSGLTGTAAR